MPAATPTDAPSPTLLRRQLRAARRAVPHGLRRRAARSLLRWAARQSWLRPGRRIGIFLPMPEEIDTAMLASLARKRGCRLYLPRVTDYRRNRMLFLPATGPLRRSRFGILEPCGGQPLRALQLDVVFVPLVGFDKQGNRLGMGRGFYDRALAAGLRQQGLRAPLRLGVAFDCQRVDCLPALPHDVPLHAVLTPAGLQRFPSRKPFREP
ncbi:MAG: hypothetical protein RL026_1798 [Pseudomonadota bacterium]|jgi:5-formyltetrahydrofolate cyclo-ligase